MLEPTPYVDVWPVGNRESMRDLIIAIEAHHQKCYHLGFGKHVTRSNLSKTNTNRDYRIFEEYAYYLVSEARRKRATDIFKLDGNVYAFDSTTISLYRAESFFVVVRAKTNLQYKCIYWKRRMPKGILTDAEIELTIYGSQKGYPEHLKLVRFLDEEQDREFMFLTNAIELTALQVADLYKKC